MGPHDPDRRALLIQLYQEGWPFPAMARLYGGTEYGVRSNIRRLIRTGVIEQRGRRHDNPLSRR